MRHICTHLQTHPEALIERAITLRIHQKRGGKQIRGARRLAFLSRFFARARTHTKRSACSREKGSALDFWFFQKSRHLNSNLGDDLDERREIRMAREAVMRRVAKVKSLFAFFFSSRVRSRKRDALTRRGGTKFSPPICHSECPFNYLLLLLFSLLTFLWRRD